MNSKVYKIKVDTPDKLLAHSLDAAGCIKKSEDQLRRTTRDLHTPAAKCSEGDGGIFDHLLRTATNLLFKHCIEIEIKLTVISLFITINSVLCLQIQTARSW
jgi:hypothetical protein